MNTTFSRLTSIAVVLFMAATAWADEPADRYKAVVDRMVDAINARDYDRARQDFAQVMHEGLPPEKSKPIFQGIIDNLGQFKKLDPPRLFPPDRALFVAHLERGTLDIRIVLDQQDKMIGLWFGPHMPELPVPEKHKTVLRLPFKGRWRVTAGGDTKELNHHHDNVGQRFAFDFVAVDKDGKPFTDEGRENEDFHAFGRQVLAPADGVVTEVIDGVRDNTPGTMNPAVAVGNAIVIRHRRHEVSVLAHFQQGTIRVKPGQRVSQGQVLGLCGNSGNSSGPHIHYHLQNTPILPDGTGIKCFFDDLNVTRDGKARPEKHYSPVKDDIVESETIKAITW